MRAKVKDPADIVNRILKESYF
jgi:hypothetical protein